MQGSPSQCPFFLSLLQSLLRLFQLLRSLFFFFGLLCPLALPSGCPTYTVILELFVPQPLLPVSFPGQNVERLLLPGILVPRRRAFRLGVSPRAPLGVPGSTILVRLAWRAGLLLVSRSARPVSWSAGRRFPLS